MPLLTLRPMRTCLASLLLLGTACAPGATPFTPSAIRAGAYRYVAEDNAGHRLLEGEITLVALDDSTLQGTWQIRWAAGADTTAQVGPQVGSGTIAGGRAGDHLAFDLNPGWADNNAILLAVGSPGGFTGRWEWETISGPRSGGRFSATEE
jgi:hypothetical protein